ncbi:MAG: universal stress protein [Acidobacteria bacterium]|nr:MAG: universal stress protein [Acidobacteriota bacterium]
MKVKNILMPTDFSSCANAALDCAIFLAEQYDARLTLLHVLVLHEEDPADPAYHFPDGEELVARLRRVARGELRGLIDRRGGLPALDLHEVTVRGVAPAPEIVGYASEHHSDLIVIGTHGRRGLRRFLLGSVAEEVVRLAPCPVLTVRGTEEQPRLKALEHVVVPYDFSRTAKASVATAKEIARIYRSRLHVVHVIQPPMDPELYDPLHDARLSYNLMELKGEVQRRLVDVADEAPGEPVPTETAVLDGPAARAIARYADQLGAALIVMATQGLTGVERFFLGSVTEKVVRLAHTPVLTLRAAPEAAEAAA